jgi:hypothetical protein
VVSDWAGVLITRIKPGQICKPHTDPGWHARYYDKFAVQIEAAPEQCVSFRGRIAGDTTGRCVLVRQLENPLGDEREPEGPNHHDRLYQDGEELICRGVL